MFNKKSIRQESTGRILRLNIKAWSCNLLIHMCWPPFLSFFCTPTLAFFLPLISFKNFRISSIDPSRFLDSLDTFRIKITLVAKNQHNITTLYKESCGSLLWKAIILIFLLAPWLWRLNVIAFYSLEKLAVCCLMECCGHKERVLGHSSVLRYWWLSTWTLYWFMNNNLFLTTKHNLTSKNNKTCSRTCKLRSLED